MFIGIAYVIIMFILVFEYTVIKFIYIYPCLLISGIQSWDKRREGKKSTFKRNGNYKLELIYMYLVLKFFSRFSRLVFLTPPKLTFQIPIILIWKQWVKNLLVKCATARSKWLIVVIINVHFIKLWIN